MYSSVSVERIISKREMGSLSSITFKKNGKGLFLSSGLVDNCKLENRQCFLVKVNEKLKQFRLTAVDKEKENSEDYYVYTAKAGNRTKTGRPRLIIRMEPLFKSLKINPKEPVTVIPIVSENLDKQLTFILGYSKVCANE